MKRTAILLLAVFAISCGATGPRGTPKFKAGDQVQVGPYEIFGQVLEADCATSPCKYVVRYLPPPGNVERHYIKETFDEFELKLFEPSTPTSNQRR